jgi:hypothetical protein
MNKKSKLTNINKIKYGNKDVYKICKIKIFKKY